MPITTALICGDICCMAPENWRHMPRKGTMTAIEKGSPEMEKFGTPNSRNSPPATATNT